MAVKFTWVLAVWAGKDILARAAVKAPIEMSPEKISAYLHGKIDWAEISEYDAVTITKDKVYRGGE